MKKIELTGNHYFENTQYYLHSESETFAIVHNSSCTADAEEMIAGALKIERNSLFNPKHLRPECKSHLKLIEKYSKL